MFKSAIARTFRSSGIFSPTFLFWLQSTRDLFDLYLYLFRMYRILHFQTIYLNYFPSSTKKDNHSCTDFPMECCLDLPTSQRGNELIYIDAFIVKKKDILYYSITRWKCRCRGSSPTRVDHMRERDRRWLSGQEKASSYIKCNIVSLYCYQLDDPVTCEPDGSVFQRFFAT